jgi:glutathione reductase (NADPH)
MNDSFDLVVIGTGTAGATPAQRCRQAGWNVAIVDEAPYGGTCALRGCDPKKVLVGAADALDWVRRMQTHGLRGEPTIDWPALQRFKRSFTDPVPQNRARGYEEAGIVTLHGRARFVDGERIAVEDRVLEARHIVIAAGARPRPLGIPGEAHVATSTDFLALGELPRRIVFIGAGYIAFEFAHVARRAGAEVTLVGRSAPLAHFDRDLVDALVAHTRELGIDVRLDRAVTAVAGAAGGFTVTLDGGGSGGASDTVAADLVVHAGGRVPATDGLDLAAGGVASDRHGGVVVNDYLQSDTNPRVYAAGDVVAPAPGKMPLTPVAGYEARLVATNLVEGNRGKRQYRAVPSVVFTIPPLALVGKTEAEASKEGLDVRVHSADTSGWYTNRRVAEKTARYKVLIDKKSDRIVGAHLLGPHAEDIINMFALAMRNDIPARELADMQYAYPSGSSDIPYMVADE